MSKFTGTLFLVVILYFLFFGEALYADDRPDFKIETVWVQIDTGDVYARVRNLSSKGFNGTVKFAIWWDGVYKKYNRRKIIFAGNDTYDRQVFNYSELGTTKGEGKLQIKVDWGNLVLEIKETNNVYTNPKISFVVVKSVKMEVSPLAWLINRGQERTFNLKAIIKLKGRGQIRSKFRWKTRNSRGFCVS